MQKYELIESKRGNQILIYNSYIYNKGPVINKRTRWRCKIRSCKGRIYTDEKFLIETTKEHSHDADFNEAQKLIALFNINKKSIETKENINEIFVNETKELSDKVVEKMPRLKSIIDNIKLKRNYKGNTNLNNFSEIHTV